jgi:hypothetical protein
MGHWHDKPPFSWLTCIAIGVASALGVWGFGLWIGMEWYSPFDKAATMTRGFMIMYGLLGAIAARTFPR